jgi:hypothetical protein
MNAFVGELIERLQEAEIRALLLKGQGIGQCYERPLWRTCGDVDLFLNEEDYAKAKELLLPNASSVEEEHKKKKHLGMTIDGWVVELHGSLRCGLSKGIDMGLDELQKSIFYGGTVRSWTNGGTQVFLPRADEDAIYVFTHILEHFYKGGIGLRQICDWCRLLYTYKETLNHRLLESRIEKMGLMTEWKTFAALAVNTLGMPKKAMPLYEEKYNKKSEKLLDFILEVGNFGHNRELSYTMEQSAFVRKYNITKAQLKDSIKLARLFPMDAPKFFFNFFLDGLKNAMR